MTRQVLASELEATEGTRFRRHDKTLGDLGEGIVFLAMVERFGGGHFQHNGENHEGPDFLVTTAGLKSAFEVKLWIPRGNPYMSRATFESKILERFVALEQSDCERNLIMIGKIPANWSKVCHWCLRNRIQPFSVPLDDLVSGTLGKIVDENPDFDGSSWANAIYKGYRQLLLLIISLGNDEFRELNDDEWRAVQPLIPRTEVRRRPPKSMRMVINGILYRLSGQTFPNIPRECGSYKTVSRHFIRWRANGTWDMMMEAIAKARYPDPNNETTSRASVVLP